MDQTNPATANAARIMLDARCAQRRATSRPTPPDASAGDEGERAADKPGCRQRGERETSRRPGNAGGEIVQPEQQRQRDQHGGMTDQGGRIAPHQSEPQHRGRERRQHRDTHGRRRIAGERYAGGLVDHRSGKRHQCLGGAEQQCQQCGAARAEPKRAQRQRDCDVVQAEHKSKLCHVHDCITSRGSQVRVRAILIAFRLTA